MKISQLVRRFEDDYLEWWNGTSWQPFVFKGSFQVYDRFITERTFGVKKRIFLSSSPVRDEHEITRTADGKICLLEQATPDYEGNKVFRHSILLRETNAIVRVDQTVPTTNAMGIETGQTTTTSITTWGDVDRYNSNQSSEFPGVVHETDILVVAASFPVEKDSRLFIDDVPYKISEIGRLLRLKELRVRRSD